MVRISGPDDARIRAWEAQLEAQVVVSLQHVMDTIAARIEATQVASAWDLIPWRVPVLVGAVTTGPTGDDDPPLQTADLAIPAPEPVPAAIPDTPDLPPGQPWVSPDDLASIVPLWQEQLAGQVLPIVAQIFVDSALGIRGQLIEAAPAWAIPNVGSLAAEQYLAGMRDRFDDIGIDAWSTARDQLSEGFAAGESIPQLAARVRQSAGLTARNAVLVARTSVIDASNNGSIGMARASGLTMLKVWIATNDTRTRLSHLIAEQRYNENPIPLDEQFIVGGHSCDYPASPELPPSEGYNCRCTVGYEMPEQATAQVGEPAALLPGTSAIEAPPEVPPVPEPEVFPKAPGEPGFDLDQFPEPPPIKVRSSLLRARTDRELIAAWQSEMRAVTGRDIIVQLPPDASLLTMREHAEGVIQMLERFPEARLRKVSWYDQASTEYAHVQVSTATLEFNARWASTAMRRDYLAQLRHDISGWDNPAGPGYGWSVRGARYPQATAWHEMAHILSIETLGGKLKAEALRIATRRMAVDGAYDLGDYVSRQISAYAATTKGHLEEMIAEAMTDVMANGPRASLLSRELYDMVAREYRARGLAVRTAEIPEGEAGFEEFTREAFPKAAAPRALSSQTVAQLRALAKERGITVPVGTRKADLVRMLEQRETIPDAVGQIRTAPDVSAAVPARVVAARAELERVRALPVLEDKSRRMSGQNAITTQVEHGGGPPTITKDFSRLGEGPAASKRRADAEELGSLVSESVGIRAPAVIRTGPRSVEMEFIEGTSGEDYAQWPRRSRDGLEATDDGRLLGLADILMGNMDRNAGNFIRLPSGRLAAIDHETAFGTPALAGAQSGFGADLVGASPFKAVKWPKSIDMAPADLALIRQRLEALRPEFERLKRATWFKQMMARLDEVEKRATGTRVRLAEAAGQVVSPEARAVARQAIIDDRRAVADSLGEVRELLANGASERALASRARLIAGRTSGQAREDLDALVKAMESGDADRIRVALGDVAQRRGLTELGPAGQDVVPFDPKIHDLVAGTRRPPVGTFVHVQRPGYSVRLDDGEIVQLSKAKVDTLTPEEIVTRTAAQERKALREAARERNRVVEAQRGTARLLAEVDELAAKGASKTAIRERLDPALREAGSAYAGADAVAVDMITAALDSGDLAKVRAAVTRASAKAKIKPIGRAGVKTTFDPDTMEGVGGIDIAPGAKVTVVRRGATLPGVETPEKAQVTPVATPSKAAPKPRAATKAPTGQVTRRELAREQGERDVIDIRARLAKVDNPGVRANLERELVEAQAKIAQRGESYLGGRSWGDPYWDEPVGVRMVGIPKPADLRAHVEAVAQVAPIREQIVRELSRQAEQTPRSMMALHEVEEVADMPARLPAVYNDTYRTIRLSPSWSEPGGGQAARLWDQGTDRLKYVRADAPTQVEKAIAHEYGHHLAQRALSLPRADQQLLVDALDEGLEAGGELSRAFASGQYGFDRVLADYLSEHRAAVASRVSTYGSEDAQELLGEIWAEYSTRPSTARAAAARVGPVLRNLAERAEVVAPARIALSDVPIKAKPFEVPSVETMAARAGVSKEELSEIRRLTRTFDAGTVILGDSFDRRFAASFADSEIVKAFAQRHQAIYNRIIQEQAISRNWSQTIAPTFARGGRTLAQIRAESVEKLRTAIEGQPIVIRRATESRLRQALDDGRLKTQFETGTSSGVLDTQMRANFEAMDFGYDPITFPAAERPIYGYVSVGGVRGASDFDGAVSGYGNIQIVLRDSVRPRITVTAGDSLDLRQTRRPSPIDQIDYRSTAGHDRTYDERWLTNSYIEAQIHGGVTWDDVAEVIFARRPEPETLAALRRRGVTWRVLSPGQRA